MNGRLYDPAIANFFSPDPMAEQYPGISPYAYCANNPLEYTDLTGMVFGEPENNAQKKQTTPPLSLNEYQANNIIGFVQTGIDLVSQAAFNMFFEISQPTPQAEQVIKPRDIWSPDYIGFTLSGDAIVGGGGGIDLTLGYVRGDGVFVNSSLRMGIGFDVSVSANVTFGRYRGLESPTVSSLAGLSFYQSFGAGFLSVNGFQDISTTRKGTSLGGNWVGGSIGMGFGSKTFYGGSAGTSLTTQPWFKF